MVMMRRRSRTTAKVTSSMTLRRLWNDTDDVDDGGNKMNRMMRMMTLRMMAAGGYYEIEVHSWKGWYACW